MLIGIIKFAVAGYATLVFLLYLLQRRLIYRPDRPGGTLPQLGDLAGFGVRAVTLTTEDGLELFSWYRPPPAGAPVILYCHGNGGHIGYRAGRLLRFAEAGYGVLLLEYRGYGGNPGRPSERGLYADGAAAIAFLGRAGIPPERIALYGESLGGAVAVRLPLLCRPAALILECPFTSLVDIGRLRFPLVPVRVLLRDRFELRSAIGGVKAPVLVLHGERDGIVPAAFGRAVLAAAPEPKEGWFAPEARHMNLAEFGGLDAVLDFLSRRLGDCHCERSEAI
ncbi:MAG TPA: alpha/beta hydrolase [Stellaceae bacterium]|nr:alpha/beta hydrolase [Stellaceae bacterium]